MANLVGEENQPLWPRNLSHQLDITKFGDWEKGKLLFSALPLAVRVGIAKANNKYATKYLNIIHSAIGTNRYNWYKFSDGYTAFKKSHGGLGPSSFFLLKGTFRDSIKIVQKATPGKPNVQVGIPANSSQTNRQGTLDVGEYAKVLEFGSDSRNIQPRKLFSPAYTELNRVTGGLNFMAKTAVAKEILKISKL